MAESAESSKRKVKHCRSCSLGFELEKTGQRADVAVVAVQPFHNDESSLVKHVPLESLVFFCYSLATRQDWKHNIQAFHLLSRIRP